MSWIYHVAWLVRILLLSRRQLALENLALRQQLAVFSRQRRRPRLRRRDRLFWVILSRLYAGPFRLCGVRAPSVE